ncbi:MAG TPA: type IV pilus modification protein PilV [Burkholderiaceae bacterium]|nr:type IV pilus modification protein PilV [Burkholderiaceae bacterium]
MQSRAAHGFTLLEVLVALLVLAVGVLGAAGTQIAALRTRQGSAQLSTAVRLASTLADHMRANGTQDTYLRLDYNAAAGAPPAADSCYGEAGCTSAELAAFDIHETMQALYLGFPGGRVRVCRDSAASMDWACSGGTGAPLVIKMGWLRRSVDGGWRTTPALALVVDGGAP